MRPDSASARYAERVLDGFDDGGGREQIALWVDRREGGLWVVGRTVDPQHASGVARADDELFSSYELDDALEHANEALEDDVRVLEEEGLDSRVAPFTRAEILPRLERWFLRGTA
jgi:hypothetical protein